MSASELTFVGSETLAEEAALAFARHRERIGSAVGSEVLHIGGTSLPGLLTTGDVDLLVRVEAASFPAACAALATLYAPLHPDAWTAEAAYFEDVDSTPHVELTLAVIGSATDFRHGDAWRQIAADPHLRSRYNAIKQAHDHGSIDEYLAAKRAFFHDNFAAT